MAEPTHVMPKGPKTAASPFDKFNAPNLEIPEAFREFAEKGTAQTKEVYERMRVGAEEAAGLLENPFKTATTGATEFNRKMIENARSNTNAIFDHAKALLGAKSPSEAIEISTAPCTRAIRGSGRSDQRAGGPPAEGHDRDRRAGQGRHHQGFQ
jgi:phasin